MELHRLIRVLSGKYVCKPSGRYKLIETAKKTVVFSPDGKMKTFRFGHYSSRRQKALDWIDKIDKKEGKVRERIKEEAP